MSSSETKVKNKQVKVRVVGDFTTSLHKSCLYACRHARVTPTLMTLINEKNAMLRVMTGMRDKDSKVVMAIMYVRLEGKHNRALSRRTKYTFDPEFIQKGWAGKVRHRLKELSNGSATPIPRSFTISTPDV